MISLTSLTETQSSAVSWEDYERADRFLPKNARKMAFGLDIIPNWIGEGDCFWYRLDTRSGKKFVRVDPALGTQADAFDHVRLASVLSMATNEAYEHTNLPFDAFEYCDEGQSISFVVGDKRWKCHLETYCLTSVASQPDSPDSPDSSSSVGPSNSAESSVSLSPDGRWAAFVRDNNILVRSTSTDQEFCLTQDGTPNFAYGKPIMSPLVAAGLSPGGPLDDVWSKPVVQWSPDSEKLLTFHIDTRGAGECFLVQSVPLDGSKRPLLHRYIYPLPGDDNMPKIYPVILDVEKRTATRVDIDPNQMVYYGVPSVRVFWTKGENGPKRLYLLRRERGYRSLRLYSIDRETGSSRVLIQDETTTALDQYEIKILGDGQEVVWVSQRDGWTHLYLYDGVTGTLKNRITVGPWSVRGLRSVDEARRVVFFVAGGREDHRDPYYRHFYRVNLDGSDLRLLTPEDAEHEVTLSPSMGYFVDTYSRVDLPPVTVLRSAEGNLIQKLEDADIGILLENGWKFPERYCAKGRDGVTDVYGVIIKPTNFDPDKKYPVIEGNYSGPHTIRTPKGFAGGRDSSTQFWQDQALAELGFIVVTADGLGVNFRSKAIQDFSYRNLGDEGFPDHIAAYRQLAASRPYMDLSRVGVYGYSAGGYGTARAVLAHPDFYKVGVAWAGNHDPRTDKATWIERYMGPEIGPHYEEQSNCYLAANLKGKLLLMHGDMDENVPPAATIQLVDALIKANKDFDLLMLPNGPHRAGNHPYVTRRRWDYFVRHLLGAQPPEGYAIKNS